MIVMFEDSIGGIPAIHAAPQAAVDRPLPTVFFFHGYRNSKETVAFFAYMLAMRGMRAILPEQDLHGARFDGDDGFRMTQFWELLKRNIDELGQYRQHYSGRGLIDSDRIGVAGTSMGGFVTLGALVRYDWIKAAANFMGSGYFLDAARTIFPPLGRYDAATVRDHETRLEPLRSYQVSAGTLDRIARVPLFTWHGMRDEIVPFGESVRLQSELINASTADRFELVIDPLGTHRVSADGAVRGVEFLGKHLHGTEAGVNEWL
ncbi:MAG TPA: esterase [Pseudorhizobium sp.]|nr:esterase [Pseudorhizobium sp.]